MSVALEAKANYSPCSNSSASTSNPKQEINFKWSFLSTEDAHILHNAQSQLVVDHQKMTDPYFDTSEDRWKHILGFHAEDKARLEHIHKLINHSTELGENLHCLKLTRHEGEEAAIAGFIEFEVRKLKQHGSTGEDRKVHIRNIVVASRFRRQGYGAKLYDAMLEFLGPGELDKLQLCVVDVNRAALHLYFKLGFRITEWCIQPLGAEAIQKVVLFRMRAFRGQILGCAKPPVKQMTHIFKHHAIDEHVACWSGEGHRRKLYEARIDAYNPETKCFRLSRISKGTDPCRGIYDLSQVDVNGMIATGEIIFENPISMCLFKEVAKDSLTPIATSCTSKPGGECAKAKQSSLKAPETPPQASFRATPNDAVETDDTKDSDNLQRMMSVGSSVSTTAPTLHPPDLITGDFSKDISIQRAQLSPTNGLLRLPCTESSMQLSESGGQAAASAGTSAPARSRKVWDSSILCREAIEAAMHVHHMDTKSSEKAVATFMPKGTKRSSSGMLAERVRAEAETGSKKLCRGLVFLRCARVAVSPGGSIGVGLVVDELGMIVRGNDAHLQPGLQQDDVILAVAGQSLIRDIWDDKDDSETYKERTRTKLKTALKRADGFVDIVVCSLSHLWHQSLDSVCLELQLFLNASDRRISRSSMPQSMHLTA